MIVRPDVPPLLHRRVFLALTGAAVVRGVPACAHGTNHEPPEIIFAVEDGFDQLADRIDDHVRDPAQAQALQALVQTSRRELVEAARAMTDQTAELASLSHDELADRAGVQELLEKHADTLAALLTSLSMHAAEARKRTTPEQWQLLFRPKDGARGAELIATLSNAVGVAGALGGINVFDQLFGYWDDALKSVKDADARSKAKQSVAAIRATSEELRTTMETNAGALQNVNLNHASPIEAYAPIVDRLRSDVVAAHAAMLDAAFTMREALGMRGFTKARRKAKAAASRSAKKTRKEKKMRDKATRKRARKQ